MSNLAAQELQSFVRRIEALDDEIRGLNSDKSEVFKEVKGAGFTAKTLRKVVAARRMDATERDNADEEFELYWNAVHGIEIDDVRAHVHVHAREADWEDTPRREFPDDSPVQVYFIAAPSLGLIKIGSTGMLDRRVAAIKRGTPVPTEFVGAISGGTKREVELHQKFAAHRVHGEWFAEAIRPEIELLLAANGPIEEFQVEHDADGVLPDDTVPSIEGVNAPLVTVASDANTGGEDVAADAPQVLDKTVTRADASELALGSAVETSVPLQFVAKPLRPYCLNPGNSCGGQGKKHCFKCQRAHDEKQGAQ